ncbi:hypothetical protein DdX_10166 [Ditylenchus destructor]|uniref:Uncharacterized protein n=1 Tax=Ditylenchus destructor TaxID=166010 RepID=A0AAD4R5L6_9BILA|nr:hypothetical protein DdX_10166 [Ditylenchus destructor]
MMAAQKYLVLTCVLMVLFEVAYAPIYHINTYKYVTQADGTSKLVSTGTRQTTDKAEADAAAAAARVGTMSRGVLTKRDGTQTGVTSDTRTEFANHGSAVVFKGK